MTFGSLFTGIGGLDLGFERAGLTCKWQVEIDPFCRRVLAKHWPDVLRHDDVRTFPPEEGDWSVDVICGGFPCQDISDSGSKRGLDGERSGLWIEMHRIIRDLRPRIAVVENVPALLRRGIDRVLGDLAACGYDAEWNVLSPADQGAPHIRERLFILAHTSRGDFQTGDAEYIQGTAGPASDTWNNATECSFDRVDDGVPAWSHRVRCLGNAVVPQVAEWIGRRLIECDR